MRYWFKVIRSLPHYPERVLVICGVCVVLSLVLDGSAYSIWQLSDREGELEEQIQDITQRRLEIDNKIKRTDDPKYLEREARERFDLVYKDDLVFVFAE